MANETAKISILLKTVLDNDDPSIPPGVGIKLLAKAIEKLCQKLDLDAGVTDVNYETTVEAVAYP